MLALVLQMHAGAQGLPGYHEWIADHMGGRVKAFRERLLPQVLAFTTLRDRAILDFGCGTGSSTVALAEQAVGASITAMDIDAQALEVARRRFRYHGLEDRIVLQHIAPVRNVGDLPIASETFDFILLNGVLEHVVPFRTRADVILEVWRLLKVGGCLYITETPNVLWPVDRHTTGLPLVPWLPSRLAYRLAVTAGKHRPGEDLDKRGRRGMSYWGIVRPLRRAGYKYNVLNLTLTANRLLPAPRGSISTKRRLGTVILERLVGKPLGLLRIPAVALSPFLEHLCVRKES